MKIKLAFLSLVVSATLITALMLPISALADDGTPPTPVPTQEDVSASTDVIIDTEASPAEESQPSPEVESVADVVEVLDAADIVLLDENEELIPLSTQAAAEIIASSDPYFFNGVSWVGYSASGVCPPVVTTCNTNSTPFQAAINAAPTGATLYVQSGTYTEQLTINKSLVIQGSGANNTFIQAPLVMAAGANGERSIVTISGAGTSVDFSGFTIQGPCPAGCNFINFGIFVRDGAYADIHDNVIDGIRDDPFSGAQHGIAIGVGRQAYGTSGTANIEDNTITDFQKGAIVVSNTASNATISGNTIIGAGPTSTIGQNGIQISGGATANITENTISGFYYRVPIGGSPVNSTGILLFQPGAGTIVNDNTVTDNNIGIYAYQSVNAFITNNTVSGSCADAVGGPLCGNGGWGIYSDQSTNITLTDNTLTDNVIGVGIDNSSGTIQHNLFDGNDSGFQNDGTAIVDATLNCWGSSTGPTIPSNPGGTGDSVGSNVLFDPWECPPPASAGATNPGTGSTTRALNVIPVTGGQRVQIACEAESMTVQLGELRVTFTGLCGYTVILNEVKQDGLPGGVGAGNDFSTGLSITLMKNGEVVGVLPVNAQIEVSYPMPANKDASILSWNGNAWDELAASEVDARLVASLQIPNTFAVMIVK